MKKLLYIYSNDKSGKNLGFKKKDYIIKCLSTQYKVSSYCFNEFSQIIDHISSINDLYALVISGGDGTLHNLVNALLRANLKHLPIIGYLPTGTMNDCFKTYGYKSLNHALKIINEGHIEEINLGKCNDQYFIYLAANGCYSDISYNVSRNEKKKVGKLSYYLLSIKEAFSKKDLIEYKIDKNLTYNSPFLMVMNGKYVGGFKVNKDFQKDNNTLTTFITEPGIFNGLIHYINKRKVNLLSCEHISLEAKNNSLWCLDGEKYQFDKAEISLVKNALKIFTKNN